MGIVNDFLEAAEGKRVEKKEDTRAPASVLYSTSLVLGSLLFGAFLIWFVNLGWVLESIAGILHVAGFFVGILTGWIVYRGFDELNFSVNKGVKMAVSIIIAFAVIAAASSLLRSHRLVGDYSHFWSSDDE